LEKKSQIVETGSDVRMPGGQAGLTDFKLLAIERFGFVVATGGL